MRETRGWGSYGARENYGQVIYGDGQDRKIWLEALERFVRTGKGTVVKKALARWLRQRTAAQPQWVCERLCIGEVYWTSVKSFSNFFPFAETLAKFVSIRLHSQLFVRLFSVGQRSL